MSARRVDVALAGATGQVGRALLALLAARTPAFREAGLDLRLVGAARSGAWAWAPRGLPFDAPLVRTAERDEAGGGFLARVRGHFAAPLVLVDCTASEALAAAAPGLLATGVAVVTANKRAGAGPLVRWRALHAAGGRTAPWRHAATVGAGLPVLAALRRLRRGGTRVHSVRAVLSGSLSAVLGAVQDGVAFSDAIAEARRRGCTEPHPGDDLSGEDVARKLLIVLRESGLAIEREQLRVEPLVPPALLRLPDAEAFVAALGACDGAWRRRADVAAAAGRRLAYVAEWDGAQARVETRALPGGDPLAALLPGENRVELVTDEHAPVPLAFSGPGAGPALTAASVLSDLLDVARGGWAARLGATRAIHAAPLASFVARAV
ncbi:MAG: aspartate kinase [Candidatus Eisenbacteria bacterium]